MIKINDMNKDLDKSINMCPTSHPRAYLSIGEDCALSLVNPKFISQS
jgi:uncharacterized Zn-finger protein